MTITPCYCRLKQGRDDLGLTAAHAAHDEDVPGFTLQRQIPVEAGVHAQTQAAPVALCREGTTNALNSLYTPVQAPARDVRDGRFAFTHSVCNCYASGDTSQRSQVKLGGNKDRPMRRQLVQVCLLYTSRCV